MKLSDFDYNLPKDLIASTHIEPRDHSRLLVYDRISREIQDKKFYDLVDFLNKGDVLVFNDSKVFKARLFGNKKTGGKIEILLVRNLDSFSWEILVKGKVKEGDVLYFKEDLRGELKEKKEAKIWKIKFNKNKKTLLNYLEKYGKIPLPPYVHPVKSLTIRGAKQFNRVKEKANFYQTIYAQKTGSVAAPTAGFHFTKELLNKIKEKGVEILPITLHVGPGTFFPVEKKDIKKHKMHEEYFEISPDVWKKIIGAKNRGGRIIAVGTTTCRVLEALCRGERPFAPTGKTNTFIYPPFDFQVVDALITNFHLPKSTLLMLVAAFWDPKGKRGIEEVKKIYKETIDKKYRFYSFGDAMFIK